MKRTEIMTRFEFNVRGATGVFHRMARMMYLLVMEHEAIRLRCGIHDLLDEWYSTPEGDRSRCDHIPPDELARLLEGGR
jgi:hypothetical protein